MLFFRSVINLRQGKRKKQGVIKWKIFVSTTSDQTGNVLWEKWLFLSTQYYYLWYIKRSAEAGALSYMENRSKRYVRARSKYRGNGAAALLSIKPCLLMFLLAEARFGNMDHNTIFIPYKSTLWSDEKRGLLSCARQVHYKEGAYVFVRHFTIQIVILFLLGKKIGTPPKHMFHKSPKSGKQDSKRRSAGGGVWEQQLGTSSLLVPKPGQTRPSGSMPAACPGAPSPSYFIVTEPGMGRGKALEAGYPPCNPSRF